MFYIFISHIVSCCLIASFDVRAVPERKVTAAGTAILININKGQRAARNRLEGVKTSNLWFTVHDLKNFTECHFIFIINASYFIISTEVAAEGQVFILFWL